MIFVHKNGKGTTLLPASVANRVPTELCTAISANGHQVKTIEHVLAALVGLEIDNVYVDVDSTEVPVMDGSASPFVKLIRSAGIVPQTRRQSYVKITQPVEVVDGARRVRIEPCFDSRGSRIPFNTTIRSLKRNLTPTTVLHRRLRMTSQPHVPLDFSMRCRLYGREA